MLCIELPVTQVVVRIPEFVIPWISLRVYWMVLYLTGSWVVVSCKPSSLELGYMKVDCWSSFYTAVVKSKEISFYFHLVLCNTHKSELGKSTGSFQLSVHNSVGDHALMTLCDWFTKNSCHNLTNQMFHLIHCWLGHACSAARGAASTKSGSDRIADRITARIADRITDRIKKEKKEEKKRKKIQPNQIVYNTKACRTSLPNGFYKLFACSPNVPRGLLLK